MNENNRAEIIDRTLKALAAPELREAKSAKAIEEMVVGARKGGKLPSARLGRAVENMVAETGAKKYLTSGGRKGSDQPDADEFSGLFALFFLLILLLLLLARFGDDSDATALLEELIQQLLDLLKGGGS